MHARMHTPRRELSLITKASPPPLLSPQAKESYLKHTEQQAEDANRVQVTKSFPLIP